MKITRASAVAYNQISNYDFQMVLIDPSGKELHGPVMCKDYFSDIFWSEATKKAVTDVYGLYWKPGTLPPGKRIFFALYNPKRPAWSLDWAANLAAFLPAFDEKFGFAPTIVGRDTDKTAVIVDADRAWVQSSPHVSLFSTLLRVGTAIPVGTDPWDAIQKPSSFLSAPEQYHGRVDLARNPRLFTNIQRLLKGVKHKEFADLSSANAAHDGGIMGAFRHLDKEI